MGAGPCKVPLFELMKKAALFLGALALSLAAAEIVLRLSPSFSCRERVLMRREFLALTRFDSKYGLTFVPNADRVWDFPGPKGSEATIRFRTVPVPGVPDVGVRGDPIDEDAKKRLLVFGDSFTFGAAAEKNQIWIERLEARREGVEFVNLALPGGISKSVMLYEEMGASLPHDAVIYQMYMGNEFWDNMIAWQVQNGVIAPMPEVENRLGEMSIAARLSESCAFLCGALSILDRRFDMDLFNAEETIEAIEYKPENMGYRVDGYGAFMTRPRNRIGLSVCLPGKDRDLEVGIEWTRKSMEAMQRKADELAKGRLLVVLFPFKEQVYFDLIRDEVVPGVQPRLPNDIILDECKARKIKCLDILPALAADRDEPLYWDYDPHFRPLGHEKAALAVEGELIELGWLEGEQVEE